MSRGPGDRLAIAEGPKDRRVYSMDRSWGDVQANRDGETFPSQARKHHRHRDGDARAACSSRILTNWPDEPGLDPVGMAPGELCLRCVPEATP